MHVNIRQKFIIIVQKMTHNLSAGWETVDQQPQFTHEEYLEFERRRQEEIQRLIAEGRLPPHPQMPYAYDPNMQGVS